MTLTTVNLSAVKLTLARLTERNVVAFVRNTRLGEPVDAWDADRISEQNGSVVWKGTRRHPEMAGQPVRAHRAAAARCAGRRRPRPLCADRHARATARRNAPTGVQMILRTDLAPTVWRGADGLTVQVRGYLRRASRAPA